MTLSVNWSNHTRYVCNKAAQFSENPGIRKNKQTKHVNNKSLSLQFPHYWAKKFLPFSFVKTSGIILICFTFCLLNKPRKPRPSRSPAHREALPMEPAIPAALIPARAQPVQSLSSSWITVCNSTSSQEHPGFVASSGEGHAPASPGGQRSHFLHLPRAEPQLFWSFSKDTPCILSALSLLTSWILQSPKQTPASHFLSWVSELREQRDSRTCLSSNIHQTAIALGVLVAKSPQAQGDLGWLLVRL